MANTELLKEQIADTYIKDFKKELGFLEWIVLWSMHQKLVDLITAKEDIGETIKDVKNNRFVEKLVSWFPETADKVYTYIKDKRIELQKIQTSQELENLKARIEWKPEPYPNIAAVETPAWSSNPVDPDCAIPVEEKKEDDGVSSVTVAVGAAAGATVLGTGAGALVMKNSKETIESAGDVLKTKESFGIYARTLRDQLKNPKLSVIQKANIEKSAKVFEDAIAWVDNGTLDALKAWNQVGTEKLSADFLKSVKLDAKWFASLQKILDNPKLVDALYSAKDVTEMQSILKANKLWWLTDEVLSLLKSSKDIESFRNMTVVLAGSKNLLQVSKAVFVAGVFDLAFIGLDAYIWRETRKEADLIAKINAARADAKKSQANTHLVIGIASGLASAGLAIAGLAASWPPGWVVLAGSLVIWAGAAALDHSLDASYFDIEQFYLQNFEEDKKKIRAELKQSVIQVINGISTGSVAVNDPVTVGLWGVLGTLLFPGVGTVAWAYLLPKALGYAIDNTVTDEVRFNSLNDLLKALIYVEQIDGNTFAMLKNIADKWLTVDQIPADQKSLFDAQKKKMEDVMSTRLSYLQDYMPTSVWDKKADAFLWGNGMIALESLLSKSRAAYDMWLPDAYVKDTKDVDTYLSSYDTKLQKEDPIAYKKLVELLANNPNQYAALYAGLSNYTSVIAGVAVEDPTNEDYKKLDIAMSYREKFEKYQSYIRRDESRVDTQTISYNMINYDYLHNYLDLLSSPENPPIPNRSQEQVFDSLIDNSLYAYELPISDHPLQNILYRIAREVYGADVSNDWLSLMSFYQESRDTVLGIYYGNRWYEWSARWIVNEDYAFDEDVDAHDFATMSAEQLMEEYFHMDMIDSAAENADGVVNKEIYSRFEAIVKDELGYRVESRKQEVKKSIEDYIKQHAVDGYIELPYDLASQALKAWLGHVEKFVYTVRDGTIYALTLWSEVDLPLWIDVQKESTVILRYKLSDDEQKVIDYVDSQFSKLNTLLSVQWDNTDEDELDLTREHELLIRKKVKDRQNIVQKMNYLQPLYAKQLLESSYKEYANFFSRMYTALLVEAGNNGNGTNDVDRAHEVQGVFDMVGRGFYTIEWWVVKLHSSIKLPSWYDAHFEKIISNHKTPDGRCIKDLLLSNKPSENILGSWYMEALLDVLISQSLLQYDAQWNLIDIVRSYNFPWLYTYDMLYAAFISKVSQMPSYVTDTALQVPDQTFVYDGKKSVSVVDPTKAQAMETTHDVTKKIEATNLDVAWQGRKEIIFDQNTGNVESRWYTTHIDVQKLSLDGLSTIKFASIQELLWVANLVNWIKQFKATHDKWNKLYRGSRGLGLQWGLYFADSMADTRLVTIDTFKQNSPSLLNSDNDLHTVFEDLVNKV